MKNLTMLLVSLWTATATASAQQKLWTWKPAKSALKHALISSAMHKDGSAVFVVSEFQRVSDPAKFLVIWVNSKGEVLMQETLDYGGTGESSMISPSGSDMGVMFLATGRIALADKRGMDPAIRIYKLEDGKVKVLILRDYQTKVFEATGFPGWMTLEAESVQYTPKLGASKPWYQDIKSVTAWKW